jgi:hypothetical protein
MLITPFLRALEFPIELSVEDEVKLGYGTHTSRLYNVAETTEG